MIVFASGGSAYSLFGLASSGAVPTRPYTRDITVLSRVLIDDAVGREGDGEKWGLKRSKWPRERRKTSWSCSSETSRGSRSTLPAAPSRRTRRRRCSPRWGGRGWATCRSSVYTPCAQNKYGGAVEGGGLGSAPRTATARWRRTTDGFQNRLSKTIVWCSVSLYDRCQ